MVHTTLNNLFVIKCWIVYYWFSISFSVWDCKPPHFLGGHWTTINIINRKIWFNIINHQPSSTIINHHQPSSTIINHHQPSSTIINHHQPSSTIINHHQPSSTIINHHQPWNTYTVVHFAPFVWESWPMLVGRWNSGGNSSSRGMLRHVDHHHGRSCWKNCTLW